MLKSFIIGIPKIASPAVADALWKDYWETQVSPAFASKPHIALETLKAAAA